MQSLLVTQLEIYSWNFIEAATKPDGSTLLQFLVNGPKVNLKSMQLVNSN